MSRFQWAAETAYRLIQRYGKEASVTQTISSAYDPVTDVRTASEQSHTVTVLIEPTGRTRYGDDGLVVGGSQTLLLPAKDLSFTPAVGDQWTLDGLGWSAVSVATTAPDGTPLYYEIAVER